MVLLVGAQGSRDLGGGVCHLCRLLSRRWWPPTQAPRWSLAWKRSDSLEFIPGLTSYTLPNKSEEDPKKRCSGGWQDAVFQKAPPPGAQSRRVVGLGPAPVTG